MHEKFVAYNTHTHMKRRRSPERPPSTLQILATTKSARWRMTILRAAERDLRSTEELMRVACAEAKARRRPSAQKTCRAHRDAAARLRQITAMLDYARLCVKHASHLFFNAS